MHEEEVYILYDVIHGMHRTTTQISCLFSDIENDFALRYGDSIAFYYCCN